MEHEESIQDLKNGIIARDKIIEQYKNKYKDPFIENEIQKLHTNNQNLLLKDYFNSNQENTIKQLEKQIENLKNENNNFRNQINFLQQQVNKNNNNFNINNYKGEIEQILKQHCDNKLNEINMRLNEILKQKIEFFMKKYEKKFSFKQDNDEKVKDLENFIMNLKREIDKKVINFNQLGSINNNIINNLTPNNFINDYNLAEISYECINKSDLSIDLYQGEEKGEIIIILKNNGRREWPEGRAKLLFEKESQINGEDILLRPQKPNETEKYKIILKGLEGKPPNQYKSNLGFYVGDHKIGEQLVLTINIKQMITNNYHYL